MAEKPNNSFSIFLASPSDVNHERKLAREAIAHISCKQKFRGRINLEIVAWDQPKARVALEAFETPQKTIAHGLKKPEECDLVVIIMWARIGTQLPSDFELKEDGTAYESGTEWEYLNAVKGYKANKKPSNIWIYRRKGAPHPNLNDPQYQEIAVQWQKVEKFFSVFENSDKAFVGGVNSYESPNDFRLLFEDHLNSRLEELLQNSSQEISASQFPTIWNGSPYPGLESFSPDQAPIYFGRGHEIDQLLKQFADPQVRFVAVVGVSGSGKSSLVKAGLLPELRAGMLGNQPWNDIIFKPGERGGNPFLAMAFALKAKLATDHSIGDIAKNLQNNAAETEKYLSQLLSKQALASIFQQRVKNTQIQSTETHSVSPELIEDMIQKLPKPEPNELLIVIDQFEELFTQSEAFRQDFILFLERLTKLPRIRCIVTMRADFYARAIEEPTLTDLLRSDRGTFPLEPPSITALKEMIVRPAEAAGIELEKGLDECLLKDAGIGPGAMALIAFTLNQLHLREQQKGSRYISISAYKRIGGVKGIVHTQAEAAIKGLQIHESSLPNLFSNLIDVNELESATRRRASQAQLDNDSKQVVDALVNARILVTSEGENNQPLVEVAHEIVLSGWERLRDWIRNHAGALRARRDLEQAAAEWDKLGRKHNTLRSGFMLQRYFTAAEPRSDIATEYLKKAKQREKYFTILKYCSAFLILFSIYVFSFINRSSFAPTFAVKSLLVDLHLLPLKQPKMVAIKGGKFLMGNAEGVGFPDEVPQHEVTVKPFEIGKHEVTFDEYDLFAAATKREKNSDEEWGRGKLPVINISWQDAVAYTQWLSDHTGMHYRLPTESEWEYAARANTSTPRYWAEDSNATVDPACIYANVYDKGNKDNIKSIYPSAGDEVFNCGDSYPNTAPVGQFKPNAWGLHDMLGNVHEWILDCYNKSYKKTPTDGSAFYDKKCNEKAVRGGSWGDNPIFVRSAFRGQSRYVNRSNDIGFRLVRQLE